MLWHTFSNFVSLTSAGLHRPFSAWLCLYRLTFPAIMSYVSLQSHALTDFKRIDIVQLYTTLLLLVICDFRMTMRYREDPLLSFPFLDLVGWMLHIASQTYTFYFPNRPGWTRHRNYCACWFHTRFRQSSPWNIKSVCLEISLHDYMFISNKHTMWQKVEACWHGPRKNRDHNLLDWKLRKYWKRQRFWWWCNY